MSDLPIRRGPALARCVRNVHLDVVAELERALARVADLEAQLAGYGDALVAHRRRAGEEQGRFLAAEGAVLRARAALVAGDADLACRILDDIVARDFRSVWFGPGGELLSEPVEVPRA